MSLRKHLIPYKSAVLSLPVFPCRPLSLKENDYESEGRRFSSPAERASKSPANLRVSDLPAHNTTESVVGNRAKEHILAVWANKFTAETSLRRLFSQFLLKIRGNSEAQDYKEPRALTNSGRGWLFANRFPPKCHCS